MKRALLFAILFVSTAGATEPQSPTPTDDIGQNLFTPEVILKYRDDIRLDDEQTKSLKEIVQHAQSKFLDLQWDMQVESGKLAQLLRAPRIDENAALAQVDRVLNLEREVKKAQLSLLVRIKNLLTPAQQEKLVELRTRGP